MQGEVGQITTKVLGAAWHPGVVIPGTVCSGVGHASQIPPEVLEERRAAVRTDLVAGTLNVRVPFLSRVVEKLGSPSAESPGPPHLGPLRMWPVGVTLEDGSLVEAFAVRHEHSKAPYLEIMSDVHFRSLGVQDGDPVVIAC